MNPRLFLDLDGVFVDCNGRIVEIFGKNYHELDRQFVWSTVAQYHPSFFKNLNPYPHSAGFFGEIMGIALQNEYDVAFLTAVPEPTGHLITAGHDKMEWVATNLHPGVPVHYVVGKENKKKFVNSRNDILIDDTMANIIDWVDAGGIAIFHSCPHDTVQKLRALIK